MRRYLADLTWALALLTRLPVVCRDGRDASDALAASIWAYPVVGAGVGALGGLAYGILFAIGLSPALCAILALAAIIATTGAFHEDGLADTADGFGGGATRERKLEIMRDHCVGTYGVVALATALALRAAAILTLRDPLLVLAALTTAGAVSRAGMVGLMGALSPARQDGLAARMARPNSRLILAALLFAFLLALLLLPVVPALTALALAALACLAMGRLAHRHIGGHTGDVLGASQQVAECACLVALSASLT